MPDILISKKNEAFLFFSCSDGIAQELSEYFAFFVPGHQFMPLFKSGMWDGKIYLANLRTRTLPFGIVDYLEQFAADRQYTLSIDDAVRLTTNFSIAEAKKFADSLKLPHIPYDHQIEAFAKSIRKRRILVVSPTASGKSLLMYLIVRFLQLSHKRGLIIVPNTGLVEQLFGDFKDYGWDSDKFVHRLYEGKDKKTSNFLTISTWQSLHLQPSDYMHQFDFVIGDEAHGFKAKSLNGIMSNLINADVRIGTTGTLDGTKTHQLVIEGHFGPKYVAATTKGLMDERKLAELKINCLILKYPEEVCREHKKDDYKEEYDFAVKYAPRNMFVRNLALSLVGNTLILFKLVESHGKPMFEDIRDHVTEGRPVFFVHGGVEALEREEVRKITEGSTNAIVVASYGTFSTGINIRNLHNIIFASPSKSRIRNLQSIGRGLRNAEGKTHVTLFDIVDDLRIGKHENLLLQHFKFRATLYNSEKYNFKQYIIELGSHG